VCKGAFTFVTISFRVNVCGWVKEIVGTQEFGSFLIAVVTVPGGVKLINSLATFRLRLSP
jgi:hypothetical protein